MQIILRTLPFVVLLVPTVVLSQVDITDDLSFDGYVATTASTVYKALHPDIFYHAKVEFDYKVNKTTEAQLQIKGQSNETDRVRLREANVRVKLNREDRIKVGNIKKPVGEEERFSEEDLATIDRTNIYTRLSPMNHIGRDIGAQFIHEPKEPGIGYNLGVYLNNSSTFAATARIESNDLIPSTTIALASVFQNLRLDENVALATVLGNVSIAQERSSLYWNVEGFAGIDPFASRFRQLAENSTTARVWLLGGKATGSYHIGIGDDNQGIEPVVVVGYFVPDSRYTTVYTLECVVGANYYLNKAVRARVNVHPLLSKNGINEEFSQTGSSFSLEFQLRW